ncbi:glycoside hydrolase superfamily [Hyaloraphidium curvatum]|nr:glycoside hydrolase superfamily [Hyaloraphidium curvatum]
MPTVKVGTAVRQTMEGFGTSLCWWAGQVGTWSDAKRKEILDLVFSDSGLALNIIRHNIGGGENPKCKFGKHMFEARDMPGYASAMGGQDPATGMFTFTWTWDADAGQIKVLLDLVNGTKAGQYKVNHLEAFNNSPPWFQLVSQCASGNEDGNKDNLRQDMYKPFADYLAQVLKWFKDTHGIVFESISPFNEPSSWWWKAGGSQEGCKMSIGAQQQVISYLLPDLQQLGISTEIVLSDDNSIEDTYNTLNRRGGIQVPQGMNFSRVNTHTYHGEDKDPAKRIELFEHCYYRGKRLWMSEYSSGGNGQHHGTSMDGAIPLAKTIMHDLAYMGVTAWVIWQAVEGWKENVRINQNWGAIWAVYSDFPVGSETYAKERYHPSKQYYVLKQFSNFIREGWSILGVQGGEVTAATGPGGAGLVIVVNNLGDADESYTFDLSMFTFSASTVERFRTSDEEACAKIPDLQVENNQLTDTAIKRSVTTYRFPGAQYNFGSVGIAAAPSPGHFGGAQPQRNEQWINTPRPEQAVDDLKQDLKDLGGQVKGAFQGLINAFKK